MTTTTIESDGEDELEADPYAPQNRAIWPSDPFMGYTLHIEGIGEQATELAERRIEKSLNEFLDSAGIPNKRVEGLSGIGTGGGLDAVGIARLIIGLFSLTLKVVALLKRWQKESQRRARRDELPTLYIRFWGLHISVREWQVGQSAEHMIRLLPELEAHFLREFPAFKLQIGMRVRGLNVAKVDVETDGFDVSEAHVAKMLRYLSKHSDAGSVGFGPYKWWFGITRLGRSNDKQTAWQRFLRWAKRLEARGRKG